MALSSKVGSFALNTGTGNQSITGIGFQPKIVIFYQNYKTADGSSPDGVFALSAGISSASRNVYGYASQDADAAGTVIQHTESSTRCVRITDPAGNFLHSADLVSLDADGFTINITLTDGVAAIINYIALGGTTLTNVAMGNGNAKTSTGTLAVTGLGFQPDCVLFFTTHLAVGETFGESVRFCLGVMNASAQGYSSIMDRALVPSSAGRIQKTNKCLAWYQATDGSLLDEAERGSLDADGYTLNWTTVSGNGQLYFWIALKGIQVAIGAATQPTTTGSQSVTVTGITPSVVTLFSANDTAGASMSLNARFSFGAGSSASARSCLWVGAQDAVGASTLRKRNMDRAQIIKMITEGSTPTVDAAADLTSLNNAAFTLNWGTADATARQYIYFVMGTVAVPPAVGSMLVMFQ